MKLNQPELNIESLLSQEAISQARREGEKQLEALTSDEVELLRDKARTDLYYLTKAVLGYRDLSPNLHGHLCAWLERNGDEQFRMILLPRSHFKSTIITIADSIRLLLRDPNTRILIAHETHEGSARFLAEIQSHFLGNPKLMALFPELIPDPKKHRINKLELELPRQAHWAEPSIDSMGVGARSQGRHYDRIKLDDIFGDKARDSKAEAEATKIWFDNVQSFLVSLIEGHIDIVGTRYSLDDVYSHGMDMYGEQLLKYVRRAEERNSADELVPIFPERFTTESFEILKKRPVIWASQYANDPVAGLGQFEHSWKRYFEWIGNHTLVVFSGKGRSQTRVKDCDICILIDPARSGTTGVLVVAVDALGRIFVLETYKGSFKDPELINLVFRLVQRWWPRVVAIEEVIFSGLYKPWIESEMRLRNVRFYVQAVKRKRIGRTYESKHDHIKALANYFSAGLVHFHESQLELITEFDTFGATDDVHLLDALAYGPQVWRPGFSFHSANEYKKAEERMLQERDLETGYSTL